jgi:GntR family transcriptional regulator
MEYILYIYNINSALLNIIMIAKELAMNIIISNSSGEPIYEQIINQIKSAIMKGELTEGELLPSIRLLAKELHISVITTKRAYEELEREGFIETVPGKGSYVSSQNKELLKEKRLKELENKIGEIITESKLIGLSYSELEEMLRLLFNEE